MRKVLIVFALSFLFTLNALNAGVYLDIPFWATLIQLAVWIVGFAYVLNPGEQG